MINTSGWGVWQSHPDPRRFGARLSCQVHSFDLVARSDWVTACDMGAVPLPDGCCDAAVFSLSLMGTNSVDFLCAPLHST